jgi:hypothetical protein
MKMISEVKRDHNEGENKKKTLATYIISKNVEIED